MLGLIVWHVALVALLVYGVTDSRLARGPRVRLYRWAYRRAGADFTDGTWDTGIELGDVRQTYADSEADHRWDEFVHNDDDPPFYAYLVTCHWCTGVYCSLLAALAWVIDSGDWNVLRLAWLVAAGVVGSVLVLTVIARLAR